MTVTEGTTPPTPPVPPSTLSDIAAAIWLQNQVFSTRAGDDMALVLLKRHVAAGNDPQAVAVLEAYEQALRAQVWADAMPGDNVRGPVDTMVSNFIRERVIADSELAIGIFGKMPAGGVSERMLRAIVALWTPKRTTESITNFHFPQELLYGWVGSQKVQSQELTTQVLKIIVDRLREDDFASDRGQLPAWMIDPKTHASVLKKLWNAYLANCGEQTMISLARIATMIRPDKFPKLLPGCASALEGYAHRLAILNYYLESIDGRLRDQRWYDALGDAAEQVKIDMAPSQGLDVVTINVGLPEVPGSVIMPGMAATDIFSEINEQRHSDFNKFAVRLTIATSIGARSRYFWAIGEKAAHVLSPNGDTWPDADGTE